MRDQPEQQAPPVQRLRMRYAKRGRLRFTSHRDFSRAFERALVRARVPVAYDPEALRASLDDALPDGLDLLEAVVASGGALADRLQASRWRISVPGASATAAAAACDRLLAQSEVLVTRMTKKGLRTFDCREAVASLSVAPGRGSGEDCAILDVVLRHGTPSVRPDDVLAGLRETAGLEAQHAPRYERLSQGPLDPQTGTVGDPLAPDRDTA